MIKRLIYGIMVVAMTVTSLSVFGCGGTTDPQPKDEGVDIWGVNAAVKVLQDWEKDYYGTAVTEAKMDFDCIKGETESAQFIITPEEKVSSFDFTVGDLTGDNGATIESGSFEVFAQKYMEITQGTDTPAPSKGMAYLAGWWPDAIIPINKYKAVKENKIEAGENQGIWVNVNVSEDTASGTYTGKGVLTLDGKEYDIPITVNVYDLTLPKTMHNQLGYIVGYGQISKAGVEITENTYDTYYWFIANKRITPMYIVPNFNMGGSYESAASNFAEALVPYAKSAIVSGYNLEAKGESYTDPDSGSVGSVLAYDYLVKVFTAIAQKNIELRQAGEKTDTGEEINMFKKLYIYLGGMEDEPTAGDYFKVRENDRRITRARNEVAPMLADYPDIQLSLLEMKHIVTSPYTDMLVGTDETGGVQTWCPQGSEFQTEAGRAKYYARIDGAEGRAYGEKTWWYFCESPRSPMVSFQIDDNLISMRMVTYMQYDYRISGNLYWNINYAEKYNGNTTVRDYWNDPKTWFYVNGDGYLTYPGTKYKMNTPISTVRLEALREAQEDYEYFWMLEQEVAKYNAAHGTDIDAREIFRGKVQGLYNGIIANQDTTQFTARRIEFIKFLESVVKDNSVLAAYVAQ